jgi:hypothetical protein
MVLEDLATMHTMYARWFIRDRIEYHLLRSMDPDRLYKCSICEPVHGDSDFE